MYAQTPDQMARASDFAAGRPPGGDDLGDHGLIVRLMNGDPSLSYDGARGLITQIRDFAAEVRAAA